ncbi:DUF1800 domain-containing protein [uncultured Rhodoblastus sp.]|uniref:DUF1800 domain-containing protein n=1 Tax=uncultured Rhodoblastus sp. TaxID=543037 RepID=UPI0025F2EA4E|nr:DUF1800 domain-containing protein [uncultured Rhodoblastus sp.]
MPPKDEKSGFVALTRFGLGPRGDGGLADASSDPRGFLLAELEQPGAALVAEFDLPDSGSVYQAQIEQKKVNDIAKQAQQQQMAAQIANAAATAPMAPQNTMAPTAPPNMMAPAAPQNAMEAVRAARNASLRPGPTFDFLGADVEARVKRACNARAGLVERLVAFWSNHFAIATAKGGYFYHMVGAFERETIRPHVFGKFADMLVAVESHPAMIFYLDNQQSIGRNSWMGVRQRRGLNENLGREILELHTLGVNGGYRQDDVIALSNMLTGWRYADRNGLQSPLGSFMFDVGVHEPAPQLLLGVEYPQGGENQAKDALLALARRPETARHIAFKLARHFIADQPPPALVDRLSQTFIKTKGDLRAMTIALIDSPEAFAAPATKMRTPWEFSIGSARLFARAPIDIRQVTSSLNLLGQPLWNPPGPNGFPDEAAAWISSQGLKLRLDLAAQWTKRLKDPPDPRELLDVAFGAAASPETRLTVSRAETRAQGLALLLMSPEAQRR